MINYIKIQTELIKAAEKRDSMHKAFKHQYGNTVIDGVDTIGIVYDGVAVFMISKKDWYLDAEKIFGNKTMNMDGIIKDHNDYPDCIDTKVEREGIKKDKLRVFALENGEEAWCRMDLLKYFDLKNCHFRCQNQKSPVFIYEDDSLIGLVLPVAH